ncbi:MAG: biopolymer transporter ExbD [Armatimonadetes bacterium]|nr:biopolymer transporter ExbD [Armatimonadota bacterium]
MRIAPEGGRPRRPRGGGSRVAPMAELNIIPLVDVILVLLIIFMATTAFVKETGLKMKLPAATTGQSARETPRDLTIALGQGGALTLDGKPINEKDLATTLRARVGQNPRVHVVIKGDKSIAYERVVRVMDMARQSGLNSVSLATELMESGAAAR